LFFGQYAEDASKYGRRRGLVMESHPRELVGDAF
jgi:hypothetical protein